MTTVWVHPRSGVEGCRMLLLVHLAAEDPVQGGMRVRKHRNRKWKSKHRPFDRSVINVSLGFWFVCLVSDLRTNFRVYLCAPYLNGEMLFFLTVWQLLYCLFSDRCWFESVGWKTSFLNSNQLFTESLRYLPMWDG